MLSMILKIICSKTEHLQFGSVHGLAENAVSERWWYLGSVKRKKKNIFWGLQMINLLPAETIATIMLVEVEELWTSTVTRTPIISPTIGLFSSSDFEKI